MCQHKCWYLQTLHLLNDECVRCHDQANICFIRRILQRHIMSAQYVSQYTKASTMVVLFSH